MKSRQPVRWELKRSIMDEVWLKVGPLRPLCATGVADCSPEMCAPMAPWDIDYADLSLAGHNTFVNVPHGKVGDVMQLYLSQKATSPHNTSAVFIVPEWPNRKWFSLVSNFQVLKRLPVGAELFSAPPTQATGRRRYLGHSKWATLILWDPPGKRMAEDNGDGLASFVKSKPSSALKKAHGVREGIPPPFQPLWSMSKHVAKLPSVVRGWISVVLCWLCGLASACTSLALKAIGGNGLVMHVRCHLFGIPATALLDSGASRSFISSRLVKKLGVKPVPTAHAVQVTLADNRVVDASLCLPRVKLKIGSITTSAALYVLEDMEDDLILGMDWLERENPKADWRRKTILLRGKTIHCVGSPAEHPHLRADFVPEYLMSAKQLKKMLVRGSDAYIVMLKKVDGTPLPSLCFSELGSDRCHPAVVDLLSRYGDVFDSPSGLPPDRTIKHTVPLSPGFTPPARTPYRMSATELQELKRQINELLDMGFIQPSSSPFASPVLLVPKPNGTWRLCVDYRALNMGTVKNRYPLPRIDDLFQQLHGAQYFSKLDFTSGYWQIEMAPEDVQKTAFTTRYGLFEWRVMPFGLTSAPSTFQRAMHHLFHDLLDKGVVVYLDDVLIYSSTLEEHLQLLQAVLQRLQRAKYYASLPKCMFAQSEIQFLGHIVSAQGIKPTADKLQAVRDWPRPQNVHDVRSFLGMCSFYRKFIHRFAHIASPLHDLTKGSPKKRAAIVWTEECELSFTTLKSKLCEAPVLTLPDPTKPFVLHTDASDFAIGAVLMQDLGSGLQPVEYYSRKLHGPEKRYDTRDREMLTIRECCRHWNHLLSGVHCDVFSDHDSLKYFFTQKDLSKRDQRWVEELQALDISIHYHEGKTNVVADALSRRPDFLASLKIIAMSPSFPTLLRDLRAATESDAACTRLAKLPGYAMEDGLLKQSSGNSSRIVVPDVSSIRQLVLTECHEACGHGGMHKTLAAVTRHFTWKGVAKDVKSFVRGCHTCQTSKPELQKPAGLLHTLPIPSAKFHTIGIDQIVALPESREGFDAILTVTDHLTKFVMLVPCKESDDAVRIASRLHDKVFSVFGLPMSIVSDRDPKYTSHFWRSLFKCLGTQLRFSTAYHPQTDGQSERTNQSVEVMLRCLCTEYGHDWADKLPRVQFALNNSVQVSTQYTPAHLMFGFQPRSAMDVFAQSTQPAPGDNASATDMFTQMQKDLSLAKHHLELAKRRQTDYANKSRRDVRFSIGDKVLLSTVNLEFNIPKKLKPRFVGPFTVTEVISDVAYKLQLPSTMAQLHPVFHVMLLKKYVPGLGPQPSPPPPLAVGQDYTRHEVQAILGHRLRRRRMHYKVLWKGYPLHEATWEPEQNLDGCDELLSTYKRMHRL